MDEVKIECVRCGGVDTEEIATKEIIICKECYKWFWSEE